MFELKRTHARSKFKDLLGQANHFLITILVGLNGVQSGTAILDESFRTSWNPHDLKRSVERSRVFALDLALIRAVDALDAYMMQSRRRPFAIHDQAFLSSMDRSGHRIFRRLEVFEEFLTPLPKKKYALLMLAIDWRNIRVHSLAEDKLNRTSEKIIAENAAEFYAHYSGLNVEELLRHYKNNEAPTFKEAASIIRLVHEVVEHFDTTLLQRVDIEQYTTESLALSLSESTKLGPEVALRNACQKIWGATDKKTPKIQRALRLVGVHEVTEISGRQLPDKYINSIIDLSPAKAFEFLVEQSKQGIQS
ncbi:hypothetical protein [Parvibaculum sp.]|uniref:hypothetical protein n=1 Tax=Parvibaculum sp. TaxID=2024848 RepID=UPI00391B7828